MRRLLVYLFFDKNGIIDHYVSYLLKSLRPYCSEICFVSNGQISLGKDTVSDYVDTFLERENIGYDVGGYKDALNYYGFDKLKEYDELILCNYTFFGPFYPLQKMFEDMSKKSCDWWGLFTWSFKQNGKMYPHIPSFWCVYRKSLLNSPYFRQYWETLPLITSYQMSVAEHEQRQGPYYKERGFIAATWYDEARYRDKNSDFFWPFLSAKQMIQKDKFPFLKRRHFFIEEGCMPYICDALSILQYLKQKDLYPVKLIYENIYRTQKFSFSVLLKQKMLRLKYYLKYKLGIQKEQSLRKYIRYSDISFLVKNWKRQ